MTWSTPHPGATVVDPDAGRPALIGAEFRRRTPEGDIWDRIVVRGIHDNGPDFGLELVVSPVEFGPCLTCTTESLAESYTRATVDAAADVSERLDKRLADLEARS